MLEILDILLKLLAINVCIVLNIILGSFYFYIWNTYVEYKNDKKEHAIKQM